MRKSVAIKGGGLAACCSAALLSRAGFTVNAEPRINGSSPVLMLSEQTQLLLRDVFGGEALFRGAIPINRRVVLWGSHTEPLVLPHSGLVMSESALLSRLWSSVQVESDGADSSSGWSLISDKRSLHASSQFEVGSRTAFTNSVQLDQNAAKDTCWVEATNGGWLFLIPCGDAAGSLISVGAQAESLLSESCLISKQIDSLGVTTGCFLSHPRICHTLGGYGWIACGSAAVAFDPIAGEGAGHALREGILASAVIRGLDRGHEWQDLISHYSNRLLSGFVRHLHHCIHFYESVAGNWWHVQSQSLAKGVLWAQNELDSQPGGGFRLNGFELESLR